MAGSKTTTTTNGTHTEKTYRVTINVPRIPAYVVTDRLAQMPTKGALGVVSGAITAASDAARSNSSA